MFHFEEEVSAGLQHARQFPERGGGIVDEAQRAAAAGDGVEAVIAIGQRVDARESQRRRGKPLARHREQLGGDVHPVSLVTETFEQRGLKAGAAAGIESARPMKGTGHRQRGEHDRMEQGVEVLVPRLEDVVVLGHRVEKTCGRPAHLRCSSNGRIPGAGA